MRPLTLIFTVLLFSCGVPGSDIDGSREGEDFGVIEDEILAIPVGNLTTNPSFEIDTRGWSGWQATLSRAPSSAVHGSSVVKVTHAAGTAYTIDDVPNTVLSAKAGKYTATVYVAAASASSVGKPASIALRERDSSGATVQVVGSTDVKLTTQFQRANVTFSPTRAGNSVDVFVIQEDAVTGNAFYADALSLMYAPNCAQGTFAAEYFNNVGLTGAPVLSRCDSEVQFAWGTASPAPGINVDRFSVRWTGLFSFDAATYVFTAKTDDGLRLWVDGEIIIDAWKDQGPTVYTAKKSLTAGLHNVYVEFYENTGGANAQLSWVKDSTATPPPAAQPPSAWTLTFADEFNGTAVDTTKWHVYEQSRGETVESPKSTTCPKASNVWVANGKLTMRTQRSGGTCLDGQPISGAGMSTWGKFGQGGGRFEARIRWTAKGNYLWGGIWTHGNTGGYPSSNASEIDIFEYIGKNVEPSISRFKPAIHYNYTCDGLCRFQNVPISPHDVTLWHDYVVEWDPVNPADPTTMQIRFYLDGRYITLFDKAGAWRIDPTGAKTLVTSGGWTNPGGPFPNPFGFDRKHVLVLSAWVGAPGVDAATAAAGYNPPNGIADLEVDYVRVYRR